MKRRTYESEMAAVWFGLFAIEKLIACDHLADALHYLGVARRRLAAAERLARRPSLPHSFLPERRRIVILLRSKCTSVDVLVRFRGDCYRARAGSGEMATLASSTSAPLYAAEAAARKFFGPGPALGLDLRQEGSCCEGLPWVYRATKQTAPAGGAGGAAP